MMNKFLNTKVLYIFISVIILIMFFLLVMRACSQKQPIQATVTPSDPVVGEEIFFSDSTSGARICTGSSETTRHPHNAADTIGSSKKGCTKYD